MLTYMTTGNQDRCREQIEICISEYAFNIVHIFFTET